MYRIFRLQYHVHLMIICAFVDIFHQQTLTHFLCSSPCLFLGYACCLRSEDHNKVLLAVWAPGESLCALEKTLHMGGYWNILGLDLVGGLEHDFYFSIYWESSSQLTNILYFSEGMKPPTSDGMLVCLLFRSTNHVFFWPWYNQPYGDFVVWVSQKNGCTL